MKLLCPSPELFSEKIKKNLKLKLKCNFLKMNNREFNNKCHDYDVILLRFNNVLKYKKNTKIKYILCPTTGTEHIDNKFFQDKKIQVLTLKNKINFLNNIRSTIEFTVYLLLLSIRNIKLKLNSKKYMPKILFQEEIYNKNIGIIGYGRIGKKICNILKSFDANIKVYEINKFNKSRKYKFVSLKNILKTCKVILIHIPLNDKNQNFLNSKKLKLINKGTIIINTSRGDILDEKFIFSLVKKNKISYFTDVISEKTLNNQTKLINKLQKKDNFYYSNHIAGLTKESVEKTDLFIYKNFLKKINLYK